MRMGCLGEVAQDGRFRRFLSPGLLLCAIFVSGWAGGSNAQSSGPAASGKLSGPTAAGSSGAIPQRMIAGSQNTEIMRHRDFAGKPCLAIGGFARAHTSNSNLYDHVVSIRNGCAQAITTEVCYFRTRDCISMSVQGHTDKQGILGTLPSIKDFQYEFRERF